MQQLVAGIATGQKSQPELIRIQAQQISVHVTQEANRLTEAVEVTVASAQGALESHITERISTLKITQEEGWRQAVTHEQQQRLLRSLKFPGMYARQNMLKEPTEDTYEWIFSFHDVEYNTDLSKPWDDFNEWLKSDSQLYWVSGKPGSGKSTLMKFLAQHPRTTLSLSTWQQSCQVMTYYFWKPGSSLQHSLRGLRLTLLHQLLSGNKALLNQLFTKFQSCDEPEDWAAADLDQALFAALASQPNPVCIFLDGLDEICVEDGPAEVLRFILRLLGLPKIKVCVSSRPEWPFESRLGGEQQLRLQDLTSRDMQVAARVALGPYETQRTEKKSNQFDDLIDLLCWKAEGVFLWLELALRDLITGFINKDSYAQLEERLQHLPSELEDLYWDMWNRLNSSSSSKLYRQNAAAMLRTVLAFQDSRRLGRTSTLTLLELQLVTQPGSLPHDGLATNLTYDELQLIDWEKVDRDVYIRSSGLLQTSTGSSIYFSKQRQEFYTHRGRLRLHRTVDFLHRSAFDFLTETTNGQTILSYNTLDCDSEPAQLLIASVALIHFNIGHLATSFSNVEGLQRQLYCYNYSDDLTSSFPHSESYMQEAVRLHLRFLQRHEHLGVEQEAYIFYLIMVDTHLLLDLGLAEMQKLAQSERERFANRVLEILLLTSYGIPSSSSNGIASSTPSQLGLAMAKLRTFGADLDLLVYPPANLVTFKTGADRLGYVSVRTMGLCYAIDNAEPLASNPTTRARIRPLLDTVKTFLDGINVLDLQARTYLHMIFPTGSAPDRMLLFGRKRSYQYISSEARQLFMEVNIAFLLMAFVSCTFSPPLSEWETVLRQCRPYLQVRCYSKHVNNYSSSSNVQQYQVWGPMGDATSHELSAVLIALYTSNKDDEIATLLKVGRSLLEKIEANTAIECSDFCDPSNGRLDHSSRICEALGLNQEEYLTPWGTTRIYC